MSQIVTINSDILLALRECNINKDTALLYLLGIYFNIDTQYINEKTKTQVNALKIVEREYKDNSTTLHKITWKVPLFTEEKSEAFAWVTDWMEGFAKINPERKGTKSSVDARMKKFFAEHPEVRVQDVFAATQAYFKTVNDPQYLKSSHKFIMDGAGFSKVSMLEQWLETIKVSGIRDGRTSKMR
jgi:hypothetical protein